MKESFTKHKYILFFVLTVLLGLVMFMPYLNIHYSLDCYQDIASNEQYYLASVAGRPLITLYFQILNRINFNVIAHQQFFTVLSIIIFSIGIIFILKKTAKKLGIQKVKYLVLPWLIISGIIWNFFTTEVFQFTSSLPGQALGFLSVSYAFYLWDETISKKKYALIFLLVTISLFFFQSLIDFFVVLTFIWILIFSKKIKKDLVKLGSLYIIPLGINYAYIRFIHPVIWGASSSFDRTVGVDYIKNFLSILRYQKFLWFDSVDLLPVLLFLFMVLSVFILLVIFRKENKFKLKKVILISILIILSALFTGFLPHFFTKDIWISQRSTTIIGAIPFLLLFTLVLTWKSNNKKYLIGLTIILLLVEIFFMNKIGTNLLANNILEQNETKNILQSIENIESTKNIKIKEIAYSNDSNPEYIYPGILSSMDINTRSLTRSWSFKSLMKFEGGINYEYRLMTKDERQKYFIDSDYTNKEGDQIITDNNTAFVLLY